MVVSSQRDATKGAASRTISPCVIIHSDEEEDFREVVQRRKSEAWRGVVLGPTPYRESLERTHLEGDEVRPIHFVYMFFFKVLPANFLHFSQGRGKVMRALKVLVKAMNVLSK